MREPRLAARSGARVVVAVAAVFAASAFANPTGPTLVGGAAQLSNPSASVLQVVNTPGTIINWNGFSIAGGETTRFVQLNAASAILNRVTGGNPSSILGRLESNGRVFLVNPNGIVFGGSSVVDVAGLIASTRDISNDNFTNGNYLFSGGGIGNVTLQNGAQILTSGSGGQVWLIANQVNAEAGSRVTVPQGQVVLAAGSSVSIGNSNLGEMSFTVSTGAGNTVNALGEIVAQRGAVGFFADTVNFGGRVSARSDAGGKGQIVAHAASSIDVRSGALLDVSADGNAGAGSIHLESTRKIAVHPGSEVLAESLLGQGGTIRLKANQIDLPAPRQPAEAWMAGWMADIFNETNQSVRAFGADAARDGTVTVEEAGSFNYSSAAIPGASRAHSWQSTDWDTPCCPREEIGWHSGLAGDGAVLYYVFDYLANGNTELKFFLERDGQSTSLGALVRDPVDAIQGLSRGGWVVASVDFSGPSPERTVRIVNTVGSVGATWSSAVGVWSIVPLPSGAVWIRLLDAIGSTTELASRVYSATGSLLTGDVRTAALGSIRAVDRTRLAGASASGGAFQHREVTPYNTTFENGISSYNFSYTYDLTQDARVLTSLQQSQVEKSSQVTHVRNSSSGYSFESSHAIDTYSHSMHFPLTGFGGGGALVESYSYWDRKDILNTDTQVLTSGGSHTSTQVLNLETSWDSSLSLLTRTPLALPSATSVSGNAGASAGFATRPGRATNTDVPPPSGGGAPTVVTGTGSGASFGGVASEGCNAAVCSPQVRAAVALVEATRSAEAAAAVFSARAPGNSADTASASEAAVRAVWAEVVNRKQSPEDIQREEAAILHDQQEVANLVNELSSGMLDLRKQGKTAYDDRVETIKSVVRAYTEREMLYQQMGLNRTVPAERKLVNAILNMDDDERLAFGETLVKLMQVDPTFGESPPKPAADPAPAAPGQPAGPMTPTQKPVVTIRRDGELVDHTPDPRTDAQVQADEAAASEAVRRQAESEAAARQAENEAAVRQAIEEF